MPPYYCSGVIIFFVHSLSAILSTEPFFALQIGGAVPHDFLCDVLVHWFPHLDLDAWTRWWISSRHGWQQRLRSFVKSQRVMIGKNIHPSRASFDTTTRYESKSSERSLRLFSSAHHPRRRRRSSPIRCSSCCCWMLNPYVSSCGRMTSLFFFCFCCCGEVPLLLADTTPCMLDTVTRYESISSGMSLHVFSSAHHPRRRRRSSLIRRSTSSCWMLNPFVSSFGRMTSLFCFCFCFCFWCCGEVPFLLVDATPCMDWREWLLRMTTVWFLLAC